MIDETIHTSDVGNKMINTKKKKKKKNLHFTINNMIY